MKHYFIFTVIALAISFATGCKKDDSTPENTKKEAIPHKENIVKTIKWKVRVLHTKKPFNSL